MDYTVSSKPQPINFSASGIDELLQNVRTIITTVSGTVPLHRSFGISVASLDKPLEVSQAIMTSDIVTAITDFEPRVEVVSVTFDTDESDGKLMTVVAIRLKEGIEL
ncbi:hypothetical protein EBB07_00740 [Paenibacillaceae bacterium]|nr:hypothetical protein EBB07_00740 [Paenibacillaceae bacterium]